RGSAASVRSVTRPAAPGYVSATRRSPADVADNHASHSYRWLVDRSVPRRASTAVRGLFSRAAVAASSPGDPIRGLCDLAAAVAPERYFGRASLLLEETARRYSQPPGATHRLR